MAEVVEGQRAFTVEDYHRMGDAGVFSPDERVELIRGVVRKMSPKGRRHSVAVSLATKLFVPQLEGRASVQVQDAITLKSGQSEPEPDIVVNSSPDPRDLRTDRSRPLLVIEVADSSLRFDREDKSRLYAEAGIPEYWIVNLVDDVLEVFRDPANDTYRVRLVLSPGESISPLSFSDIEVQVADLIP